MSEHLLPQLLLLPIGWSTAGQARTYRVTRSLRYPSMAAASRRVAAAILRLDMRSLAADLAPGSRTIP
jgi:hypothetical protein